jgi:hypothetical protein
MPDLSDSLAFEGFGRPIVCPVTGKQLSTRRESSFLGQYAFSRDAARPVRPLARSSRRRRLPGGTKTHARNDGCPQFLQFLMDRRKPAGHRDGGCPVFALLSSLLHCAQTSAECGKGTIGGPGLAGSARTLILNETISCAHLTAITCRISGCRAGPGRPPPRARVACGVC